jgi:hypothetical protein
VACSIDATALLRVLCVLTYAPLLFVSWFVCVRLPAHCGRIDAKSGWTRSCQLPAAPQGASRCSGWPLAYGLRSGCVTVSDGPLVLYSSRGVCLALACAVGRQACHPIVGTSCGWCSSSGHFLLERRERRSCEWVSVDGTGRGCCASVVESAASSCLPSQGSKCNASSMAGRHATAKINILSADRSFSTLQGRSMLVLHGYMLRLTYCRVLVSA